MSSNSEAHVNPESVLAGKVPNMTAGDTKGALGRLATGLSEYYQTYDIVVGYHTATNGWKTFIRVTAQEPEELDWCKTVKSKHSLEVNLVSQETVFFEPDSRSVDFDAELALLEQVTQIAMYKGTPFLLKCNGDIQERDCIALEAVLRIDNRGLDGVIERSNSWLWVPPF